MKLYKSALRDSECCHVPATLADLRAALAEHGMVSVPVEPTEEMVQTGFTLLVKDIITPQQVARAYKAMIAAAQEQK